MSTTGLKLRELREKSGLTLRKAAVQADIDVAILSKMERGERKLTKELIIKLAEMYKVNPAKLIVDFLSEKVVYELKDEEFGLEALKIAEKELKINKVESTPKSNFTPKSHSAERSTELTPKSHVEA